MRPNFSVLFLTTLIGAGQGLFIALFACELLSPTVLEANFFVGGSAIILVFTGLGLLASFFHLGHPERAWRAMMMWRTSWLSREVIALPAFMGATFAYGVAHYLNMGSGITMAIGIAGVVLSLALFVCTAMIYAAVKVLKEWAHPLTVVNFTMLGSASGLTLAAAYSSFMAPSLTITLAQVATLLTTIALITRLSSLMRNAKLNPASTLQTAIGIKHPRIVQKSQGAMGGSYNTREYFHGRSPEFVKNVVITFMLFAFLAPVLLVMSVPVLAFVLQYTGLLAERWFFFAEAKHPQNLYYQNVG